MSVFVDNLAIQSVSARPRDMDRRGGRHNRQNAGCHAVPSRDRRALSIANNPKDIDCGRNCKDCMDLPLLSNGPYTFVQRMSAQRMIAHHDERLLHGLLIRRVSVHGWGQNHQNTRSYLVPSPSDRVLSIASIRRRFGDAEKESH